MAAQVSLLLLLLALANPASAAEAQVPKTSIPSIANIAGVKIGYSSMEELEKRLGKGKVMVGGHPNGARLWRVKGTLWVVYADAFEYSKQGIVVDSFSITTDPNPGPDVPYTWPTGRELAWLGGISLGIHEDKLLEILKQNALSATKVADCWLLTAKGYSPLTSVPTEPFQEWTVRFSIKKKSLAGMQFDARPQARESTK